MKVSSKRKRLRWGQDDSLGRALDGLFEEAIKRHVFPGASLLVASSDAVLLERSWGRTHYAGGRPVDPSTHFDLASLTKPLVTTLLSIRAIRDGRLALDCPLSRLLPAGMVPGSKAEITVFHLLSHCSGLPAYRPFYRALISVPSPQRRETLLEWILEEALTHRPGVRGVYSDLGFMLLGFLLEEVLGGCLDDLITRLVLTPLGISELAYRRIDSGTDPTVAPQIPTLPDHGTAAPTEQCSWRQRELSGEVHDENAYCLQGVAGHSGLFGTAGGIFRLLSHLLDVYRGTHSGHWFDRDALRLFWRRPGFDPEGTWALGFDTPSASGSSAGMHFSPRSVGHLGFTGTSFWLDLEREIMVILLTNRVHPTRVNDGIKAFRPAVHNLVMESLYDD